jgi:predicted RNA-binding protein with PUA-like domain
MGSCTTRRTPSRRGLPVWPRSRAKGIRTPIAFKKRHRYYDADSDPESPTWYTVDIGFVERFAEIVPLATLKATPGLAAMMVVQKGSRLSVQPVKESEWKIVLALGRRRP